MARCLIVGCGCRGRALAAELLHAGHAVRGTTRSESGRAAIEQVGAEAFVCDPDRLATVTPALEHVGILCLLLGSASGTTEQLAALHGPRLDALMTRILDTTVRGVVYEARGSVDPEVLRGGAECVRAAGERSRVPVALLDADPAAEDWVTAAFGCVQSLLH